MKFLDFFKTPKRTAASVAKERLQIIVSHESARHSKDFIKDLQRELLEVISKYVDIDPEQIKVQLEQHGDQSVLELNVTLPELVQQQGKQATQAPKPVVEKAKKAEQAEKTEKSETTAQSDATAKPETTKEKSSAQA